MKKGFLIVMIMAIAAALSPSMAFAADLPRATTLDNAPFPDYNYARANKLPLTGYFEKSFTVKGAARTAKFYISPDAPVRPFFFIVAVPDGVDTSDFIVASGWKDLADANESCLFVLEPARGGWGKSEDELDYINVANAFYKGNRYFSIFGENYLAGYGAGGMALGGLGGRESAFRHQPGLCRFGEPERRVLRAIRREAFRRPQHRQQPHRNSRRT